MAFTPFTKDDKPTMAAFNEKFQEIIGQAVTEATAQAVAEAFAADAKIASGSYDGTGEFTVVNNVVSATNEIHLGFRPKFFMCMSNTATFGAYSNYTIWCGQEKESPSGGTQTRVFSTTETSIIMNISGSGLGSSATNYVLNASSIKYHYFAIG